MRRLLTAASRPAALWGLALATLILAATMVPPISDMSAAGASLTAFEQSATSARAAEILATWGADGRDALRRQVVLDFPFLIAYGLFLAGACTALARRAQERRRPGLARALGWLALGGLAAAAFDVLENVALLVMVEGHVAQPWPALAWVGAVVPLVLAAAAIGGILAGLLLTRGAAVGAGGADGRTRG